MDNYEKYKQKAQDHAQKVKQRQELKEIYHSNDKKKEKIAFSKIAVGFIFLNAFIVQIYVMFVMLYLGDISNIGGLIGLVGTLAVQGVSLISYNHKATKENTGGGIVFEAAKHRWEAFANESNEATSEDGESVG